MENSKKYIQNTEVIQSKIGEEVVMLDIETGFYFGLNSVASTIWELMKVEISFDALIDELMAQFDVDRALCETDTIELINEFLEKKIIRVIP